MGAYVDICADARVARASRGIGIFSGLGSSTNTNMNDDDMIAMQLPSLSREFPPGIEFLLPLRRSFVFYKKNMSRVLISNEVPEINMKDVEGLSMIIMMCQVAIVSHVTMMNEFLRVCEFVFAHVNLNVMFNMIRDTYTGSLKWVTGGDNATMFSSALTSRVMIRSAICYKDRCPLLVYTSLAVSEAVSHSSNSPFWTSYYPKLDSVDKHYGLLVALCILGSAHNQLRLCISFQYEREHPHLPVKLSSSC